MSYSHSGYRAIGQLDISAGAGLPTVDTSALKPRSTALVNVASSYQAPTAFGPISIMKTPTTQVQPVPSPSPSPAPTKAGTVGDMCDLVSYLSTRIAAMPSALFKLPSGVSVNGQQILEMLKHREIQEACSRPRGTQLWRDAQEEYFALDFIRQQLPPEPTPPPRPPVTAPEVSQPHDSTSPVAPEAEYYQDEWSSAMPDMSPTVSEPAASEPLLPQEKKFPWLLALGGVAVVGVGGYLLLR